jgi:hypothetical protein
MGAGYGAIFGSKLGFPQPLVIRKRRYWRAKKLAAWEQAQAGKMSRAS